MLKVATIRQLKSRLLWIKLMVLVFARWSEWIISMRIFNVFSFTWRSYIAVNFWWGVKKKNGYNLLHEYITIKGLGACIGGKNCHCEPLNFPWTSENNLNALQNIQTNNMTTGPKKVSEESDRTASCFDGTFTTTELMLVWINYEVY